MLDLLDEARSQESGELLIDRLPLLLIETAEALLHTLSIGLDVEVVLGDLARDAGHV